MIKAIDLSKSYGKQTLFENISFNINKKERVGLVGRNGQGKTTLFRLLLRQEEIDSGTISIPKTYIIAHLDQHIYYTKDTVLNEGCLGLPSDQKYDHWRVEETLMGLGFSEDEFHRPPSELSGGYQIRLNLAKILISDPDLLLLDEPTNYLDVVSIRWFTKFLRTWQKEMILITHDRSFMDSVTTHTMVIHRQKIKKISGNTEKLYNQIAQEEEVYEKTRLNDEKKRKEVEVFIRRFRAKARLAGMVQSRIKALNKNEKRDKLERIPPLELSFNAAPFAARYMISTDNVSFSYNNLPPYLIDDFSIAIKKDDRIGVIGKNGKGKSTLLKILAQVLNPIKGEIKKHPNLKMGYFGQTNKIELHPQKTVYEEIMASDAKCTFQRARSISGSLMFEGDDSLKKISVLSGGEKSRVLLGKILASPCHLLLLDEPSNHLDMESCDSLMSAMDSFGGAVVLVTHNEMYLRTLVNRLIIFDRNKISVYEGTYQDFLDNIGWEDDEAPKEREKRKNNLPKKEVRKLKANILNEKTNVLTPFKNEIKKTEKLIENLEKKLNGNNKKLIEASEQGDGSTISDLSKKNHQLESELEELYENLDKLICSHEGKSKEFEEKLEEL